MSYTDSIHVIFTEKLRELRRYARDAGMDGRNTMHFLFREAADQSRANGYPDDAMKILWRAVEQADNEAVKASHERRRRIQLCELNEGGKLGANKRGAMLKIEGRDVVELSLHELECLFQEARRMLEDAEDLIPF
jgi:hypothetical protein